VGLSLKAEHRFFWRLGCLRTAQAGQEKQKSRTKDPQLPFHTILSFDYLPVATKNRGVSVLMKIKKETDGSSKNAKFTSQGGIVIGGQLNNLPFYGSCKVSGKSIVSTKLPFTPPL
jgi:hypothetical protein